MEGSAAAQGGTSTVVQPDSTLLALFYQTERALQRYIKPRITTPRPLLRAMPPDPAEKIKESKKRTRSLLGRLIQLLNDLPVAKQWHGAMLLRQVKRMPNDLESLDILCGRAVIMDLGREITRIFEDLKAEWVDRQELKDIRDGLFPRPDRNRADTMLRWRKRQAWRKQREGLDLQDRQSVALRMGVDDDAISEEGSIDKDLADQGFDQPGRRTYDAEQFVTQMADDAMPDILGAFSRACGGQNLSEQCRDLARRELFGKEHSNAWNVRWDNVAAKFPAKDHDCDVRYIHTIRIAATAIAAEHRHYMKRMMDNIPSGTEDDTSGKHLFGLLTNSEERKHAVAVFVSGYKALSRFLQLERQIQPVLLPGHLVALDAGDSHANIADREKAANSSPVVVTLLQVIGHASHITWRAIQFEKAAGACTDPNERHKIATVDAIHLKKLQNDYSSKRHQLRSGLIAAHKKSSGSLPDRVNTLQLQILCYALLLSHVAAILQRFEGYMLYMKATYGDLIATDSGNDGGDDSENVQFRREDWRW
ncbi:hypothetical protein NpPPO83_00008868 [Neofusicoccum parvum]|uniref:Uncharacterized protein n=1 Tax=Neofusicoccum parvum TaxID=310453 RepID=A0ACB5S116_9PEZI|nr:hypothetical protein NpPPO83_00008868 [Neofusicoccum parvum]